MNKRGVSITFNTIIIAIIALLVLIVLWVIFTGGIKKGAGGITGIGDESVAQVNKVSWCMSTTVQGKSCDYKSDDAGNCDGTVSYDNKCKLKCDADHPIHKWDSSVTAIAGECKEVGADKPPENTKIPPQLKCCS